MTGLRLPVIVCLVFVFCAAATISSPAQTLTTLHNFAGPPHDGATPDARLVQGTDGNFYGTTRNGGAYDKGSVFKMTRSGALTTLHSFEGWSAEGSLPEAELFQGRDGNFYGTTQYGGSTNHGTVFKITPSGAITTLHSFNPAQGDGNGPIGGLIQARDGNFYGTTELGGTYGGGTVFKMTPSGNVTILYSFDCGGSCNPVSTLVQDSAGNLDGTASQGGHDDAGALFGSWNGIFITWYGFCDQINCTDGSGPYGGLIQANDGYLYGTTLTGGAANSGTVFLTAPGATVSTVYSFHDSDGGNPYAGLVQGSDGNFYGTTASGGANGGGTIFRLTPQGALSTLHSFAGADGDFPAAGLLLASDGNFYGTTSAGGTDGYGTIFKLPVPPPGNKTLTVTLYGQGTVTSSDGFINCPGVCSHSYPYNTQVTLDATAAEGYVFQTWGNACFGAGAAPCQLTMTQDLTASATFALLPVTLTVSIVGSGSVTSDDGFINCPGTCTHVYGPYGAVTLHATAASGWSFSGWTGACMGGYACYLTMDGNLSVTAVFLQAGSGAQFMPTVPCRLVDTRKTGRPIAGGTAKDYLLSQLGGCVIPSDAVAYSLNVTVVPHGYLGYLTIWPTGEAQPQVSTMNSLDGRIKANAAIVGAGANGAVSVYVTDTSDLVLDIDGYFLSPGYTTLAFYPLAPCRVFDTRWADGDLGGPYLPANTERYFPILEATACDIPSTAKAYSMNFTAIPLNNGPLGYLTAWPTGEARTTVSTLNDLTGTIVANAAIVPAGMNGAISLYGSYDTNVVADINGYFAAPGPGGLSLYAGAPCRIYDSRSVGNGQGFDRLLNPPIDVGVWPCGVASSAQAYVLNATVLPYGALGYLSLWPDGENQPAVSTLNAMDGAVTSNMAIVPNLDSKIDAYASGATNLVLDISSYFAP